jgi:hypothetical protein
MKSTGRIVAALLLTALLPLFFALPSASAGGGTEVWVNNVYLSSISPYWKNGNAPASASDWNAYLNAATATLTLKDASIDTLSGTSIDAFYRALVYADGNLTVVLEGDNQFQYTGSDPGSIVGIYATGSLTVNGSGSATMGLTQTGNERVQAIYSTNMLTIAGGSYNFELVSPYAAFGFVSDTGILFSGGMAVVDAQGAYPRVFAAGASTLRITGGLIKGTANSTGGNAIAITADTLYLEGGEGYFRATGDGFSYGLMVGVLTLYVTGGEFIIAGATKAIYPVISSDLLITGRAAYVSEIIGGVGASLFITLRNTTQTVPLSSFSPYRYVHFVADAAMPQTGDRTMPWLWVGIALFATLGAAALVLKLRKSAV